MITTNAALALGAACAGYAVLHWMSGSQAVAALGKGGARTVRRGMAAVGALPWLTRGDQPAMLADGRGGGSRADAPVIACTLGAESFRRRAAELADVARRHLRAVERAPLATRLVYAPEAFEELTALVAEERECCAFLTFELTRDADAARLTITAPESARDAVGPIFDLFAPGGAVTPA